MLREAPHAIHQPDRLKLVGPGKREGGDLTAQADRAAAGGAGHGTIPEASLEIDDPIGIGGIGRIRASPVGEADAIETAEVIEKAEAGAQKGTAALAGGQSTAGQRQ